MRAFIIVGLLALLAGPVIGLVAVVTVMTRGSESWCSTPLPAAGESPDGLIATTSDGTRVALNRTQLGHAATIIDVGARTDGVGRDGVVVALMAALTESSLRMLANTGAYPESGSFPNDGDASDHDSLGLFQMRPVAGWGTVADLMNPDYQAAAFFGGPGGPNGGSPRGLLDIPDWTALEKGEAAQAVEVSAYPDRYARFEPVAEQILDTLTSQTGQTGAGIPDAAVASTRRTVFPLPASTWTRTSEYGMRLNPVLHIRRLHAGVDLAAHAGTPVLATAPGRVVTAEHSGGLGIHVAVEHTVEGEQVVSVYGHLRQMAVAVGDVVAAGQVLGEVGSTGNSTGPHLHFEIRPGGPDVDAIDPSGWLEAALAGGELDVSDVTRGAMPAAWCGPQELAT